MAKIEGRWARIIRDDCFNTSYQAFKEFNGIIYNSLKKDTIKNLLKKHDEAAAADEEEYYEEVEEEISEQV